MQTFSEGGIVMKTGPTQRYRLLRKPPQRDTAHDLFDGTLQKTQIWLNDLMSELDWENHPNKAYLALRTVLHALRDRLTVEEAVQRSEEHTSELQSHVNLVCRLLLEKKK